MLIDDLRAALPADRVVTDPDVLRSYAHDEAEWAPYALPAAVVRPRGAEDVQAAVRECIEHGAPLVTRGAGTGLSGGANAVEGCVLLAMDQLNGIKEIDPVERLAVVEPGVVNDDLRAVCGRSGTSGIRRIRPVRRGRRSAATWRPTPAACAA